MLNNAANSVYKVIPRLLLKHNNTFDKHTMCFGTYTFARKQHSFEKKAKQKQKLANKERTPHEHFVSTVLCLAHCFNGSCRCCRLVVHFSMNFLVQCPESTLT